jgi:hypothetical protein
MDNEKMEKLADAALKNLLKNKGLEEAFKKDFEDFLILGNEYGTRHTDKWMEEYKQSLKTNK